MRQTQEGLSHDGVAVSRRWLSGIAILAHALHHGQLRQQRQSHILGKVLATVLSEDVVFILWQLRRREPRHILHEAEQWHVHLFVAVHVDALACISERNLLRSTYNDGSRNGQRLQQGEMDI